jgi:hypothetical protein
VQDRLHTCKKWTKGQFLAGDSSQMWMGGKTKRGFDGPKPKCDWEISQSQKKTHVLFKFTIVFEEKNHSFSSRAVNQNSRG